MKQKLSSFIILIGISVHFSLAQKAPGYMGKRFNIHGMIQAKNSFLNPTEDGSEGLFKFNKQFGLGAEYAINKRSSMIVSYNTFTTSKSYEDIYYDINSSVDINLNDVFAKLDANSYSFEYRRYPNSLAPMGGFIGYIINYKTIDLTQPEILKLLPLEERPFNQSPYSLVSLGLSMGKQRIFFNCLVISGSINFLLPVEFGKMGYLSSRGSEEKYNESPDVYRRILNHDLVNLKMGVGLLL